MRCLLCDAEMILMNVVQDDTAGRWLRAPHLHVFLVTMSSGVSSLLERRGDTSACNAIHCWRSKRQRACAATRHDTNHCAYFGSSRRARCLRPR